MPRLKGGVHTLDLPNPARLTTQIAMRFDAPPGRAWDIKIPGFDYVLYVLGARTIKAVNISSLPIHMQNMSVPFARPLKAG